MGWFKALPLLWRLLTVLGVVVGLLGAVGGLYAYVKHQGYVEGYADAQARCEAEKAAQEAANKKAISSAEKKLFETADKLSLKDMELSDAIKQLDEAAGADPGADRECLPRDSVRRLQTFR